MPRAARTVGRAFALSLLLIVVIAAHSAAQVTLTFWNGFTGPDRPTLEALVEEFNATHPHIQIEMDIVPWDSLFQKLLPSYVVGRGPDIAAFHTERIPQYADAGVLAPLDDIYEQGIPDPQVLVPAILENSKFNGATYGVPMNFATLLLYYNKEHFREAGLGEAAPSSWAEWREAIIKLTTPPDRYGLAIAVRETIPMWPILMWGGGGGILEADGTVLIDSRETKDAVRYWVDVIVGHQASPLGLTGAEADKLFQTGRASMEMVGPWMTAGFTEAGLDFDVAPIPTGPAGPVTLGNAVAMVLSRQAAADPARKAAAYEFFKFWNSKAAQVKWALGTGFPPTRTDLADVPEFAAHPWVPKFAAAAPHARFYLQGTPKFAEIESDVLVPALENILLGRAGVDSALDEAGRKLRNILAR